MRLHPQYVEAYNNHGRAWAALHQPERALADFDEAVRLQPRFAATAEERDWVVHSKAVGDGRVALWYLAPYVYRVAVSN